MGLAIDKSSQAVSLSRRSFFRGDFGSRKPAPIRPPWSLDETAFLEVCTGCDDCRQACPERIIIRGAGAYPEIDFSHGECTFCTACAEACRTDALSVKDNHTLAPWTLRARIGDACLSTQGVTCRVCGDRCDARAIRFELAVGGIARPIIDKTACTGCGACIAPCPVGTVEIVQSELEEQP